MQRILRPFNSIFDLIDWPFLPVTSIFGAFGCYKKLKKPDGSSIFITDDGFKVSLIASACIIACGFPMTLFAKRHELDSELDDAIYKGPCLCFCPMAVFVSLRNGKIIEYFLESLRFIDVVDREMKAKNLVVSYEKAKHVTMTSLIAVPLTFPICYEVVVKQQVPPDQFLYTYIQLYISFILPFGCLYVHCMYLAAVALTLADRFNVLKCHLEKLENETNPKIVEQDILKISQWHMLLCKSWKATVKAFGLATVLTLIFVYINAMSPVIIFGLVGDRLKKFIVQGVIASFVPCLLNLYVCRHLKNNANYFINGVIKLNFSRPNEETNVRMMCKTLLLQIKHLDIDLKVCGCIVMDFETLFEGLKSSSTLMMFFISFDGNK